MRFAHVSDVHLLALDGARPGDFVSKRAAGGLNLLFNRHRYKAAVFDALVDDLNTLGVEQVVCTGDVTNLSLESEFRFARSRFDRIAVGPEHVTVVPGNHDRYVPSAEGRFEATFDPYCTADPPWQNGKRWPMVRIRGELAILGLSTSIATGWLKAYGRLGGAQLARLEEVMGDPRLANKFRLVLLHHPPAGRRARRLLRGLKDHQAFGRVLSRVGAELVLHGHEHLDLHHLLGGIPVRGIQSGTYQRGHGPRHARYRIYVLGPGPAGGRPVVVSEEVRVFVPAARRFDRDSLVHRTITPA